MNKGIKEKNYLIPNCDIDRGVWESISQKLQQRFKTLKFAMENWSVVKLIFTQNFWQKYLVSNIYWKYSLLNSQHKLVQNYWIGVKIIRAWLNTKLTMSLYLQTVIHNSIQIWKEWCTKDKPALLTASRSSSLQRPQGWGWYIFVCFFQSLC